ncbi:efflux RND transporter permease subunit [Lusitaniella coriacea]|uniref:efflux RND transporter permease subunit n=1 Tax=Lusitaniella coriacea TaxID=1983105 RepID=UPI003CE8D71B
MTRKLSWRERLNISRWAIARPWLTLSFWLAIAVAGLFAFSSLKYALFPDITFPVVVVQAKAPLDTALETEGQLTQSLEESLGAIARLDSLRSSTYPGQSVINLAFSVGTDLQASTQSVKTQLQQAQLPPETTFEVIPLNLNESTAISYAIKSRDKTLPELTDVAKKQILPPISQLPGVLRVDLLGDDSPNEEGKNNASNIETPQTLVRFNKENALAFRVIKQGDANTLDVVASVEQAIQTIQAGLPDVRLTLAETQADYIREATQATIDALILAIILAVLVIFPFLLNWRATLIAAIAIPLSLLGTCIVMAIAGFNLETITLLALALVIGIIVDDAIVDVENISRHIEAGEPPKQAAIRGTDEIGLTVTASTLTIVAVFLPVALMGGTIGQFFKPFGLTVSAAVVISLLVARTLSPVLSVWWLRPKQRNDNIPEPDDTERSPALQTYRNLLQWSLNHRGIVVIIAIASFAAGVALIPLIPKGFIPKLDRGEFNIIFSSPLPKLPGGSESPETPSPETNPPPPEEGDSIFGEESFDWLTDLAESPTKFLLNETRATAEKIEAVALQTEDVESAFTVVGVRGEPNKGKMYVKLRGDRLLSTSQIQEQLRAQLPQLEDVTISIEDIQFVDTIDRKPLQIALLGDNLEILKQAGEEIKTRVERLSGFVEVEISSADSDPQKPSQIDRLDGKRAVYFSSNLLQGKALGDATTEALAIAQDVVPPTVTLDLKGDAASSNSVLSSFSGTLTLAAVCMLGLLILLFKRLLEPLVVGLSLPLSIVGAMLALLVTQSDFGTISLIGIIFLLGLLDKNALLLMDYANQLRQSGLNRTAAILETGQVRLRPILMTTLSTILGMVPIALGLGAGAELRQPMAVTIIGGLLASTLLSLIVVPVLYSLLEDSWIGIKNVVKGK